MHSDTHLKIATAGPAGYSYERIVRSHQFFPHSWHIHTRSELTLIVKGHGHRFLGDTFTPYHEGDLVLVGTNVIHRWRNVRSIPSVAINIRFFNNFPGDDFAQTLEMTPIQKLVEKASHGIHFLNPTRTLVAEKIKDFPNYNTPYQRVLALLEILGILAESSHYKLISKSHPSGNISMFHTEKMELLFQFLHKNFREDISQIDAAKVVSMTPTSFSRFFKQILGKTFSAFLNEIRIGHASCLLLGGEKNITTVCFESGFNNVSNFNEQFRKIRDMSPREFQKHFVTESK